MKIVITERQEDLLMENIPIAFRRRYDYNVIKNHLEFSILENNNACEYDSIGNFISDICNMMVEDLIDDYYQETNQTDGGEIEDELHHFMVHNFGYYLRNFYNKQCA